MTTTERLESKKINKRILKIILCRRAINTTKLADILQLPRGSVSARLSLMEKACIVTRTDAGNWRLTFHGQYAFIQLESWFASNPKNKKEKVRIPILKGYQRWGAKRCLNQYQYLSSG
jgi:DNA-binding transcriptional regulator GbsR (MarR family)